MFSRFRGAWAVGALLAVALAAYWSALRYPPVFDDSLLSEAFLRAYAASWFRFDVRWFSYASFGWVYEIFGRDWFWQRLANVLLHAAVAAMLFVFLKRLFAHALGDRPGALDPGWWAFSGALLFVLHPVAVYATAYLVQRSIVMATLFSLVSLHCVLEGLLRRSWRWQVAAGLAYLVAIYSKEHAIMLPAVAAVLGVLVRGPSPQLLRALAPALGLCAVIGAFLVLKLKGVLGAPIEPFAADALRQVAESRVEGSPADASYLLSVLNQGHLFFRYLFTWIAPFPGWMSIDVRPAFPLQLASWPQAAGFAAWLAWPFLGGALLLSGGRAGLAGFAMLAPWFLFVTEVAGLRVQEMFVLYRSYLWMCLLPAALPVVFGRLPARWAGAALAVMALALLAAQRDRLATFSSEIALWDDAVRKNAELRTPFVDRTWRNRGVAYYRAGRQNEALADFERALELDPRSAENWMMRGTLHMRAARSAEALSDFDRALELDPVHVHSLGRRCVVRMRLRQLDGALADCTRALEIVPGAPDNLTSLGMVHALRGEVPRAEERYRRALALDAANGDANYQFGVLLRGTGRAAEARPYFAAACRAGVPRACDAAR